MMEYREIGKTGLKAGVIGLGGEHLDGRPLEQVRDTITAALDGGIKETLNKSTSPQRASAMVK